MLVMLAVDRQNLSQESGRLWYQPPPPVSHPYTYSFRLEADFHFHSSLFIDCIHFLLQNHAS